MEYEEAEFQIIIFDGDGIRTDVINESDTESPWVEGD